MSPFARAIRFADAVYAVGATPKTIRNWLARGQVSLSSERGGGWHAFSVMDLILLSLINKLVKYGLTVEEADQLIVKFLDWRCPAMLRSDSMPLAAIGAIFNNWSLIVHFEGGEWQLNALFGDQYPENFEIPDVCIYLDVGSVIASTLERLTEIAGSPGGGPSDDAPGPQKDPTHE